jgi:endoglucanase
MASQFTTPNSNQIARHRFLGSLFAAIVFISAAQGQSAYIRVNQVGYPSAESKRAYLMATGSENGTTFVVKNSAGITAYSGAVGATLGAWGSFKFVYPIDFDSVTTAWHVYAYGHFANRGRLT